MESGEEVQRFHGGWESFGWEEGIEWLEKMGTCWGFWVLVRGIIGISSWIRTLFILFYEI